MIKLAFCCLILGCSVHSLYGYDRINSYPRNAEVLGRLKDFLPENPVIIEAGTYNAKDTIEISLLLPEAQIFTLEAVPSHFHESSQNLKSFSQIKIYNYALSDQTGVARYD